MRPTLHSATLLKLLVVILMITSPALGGAVVSTTALQSGPAAPPIYTPPPPPTPPAFSTPATSTATPEDFIPIPEPRVPLLLDNPKTLRLEFSVQLNALYDMRPFTQVYDRKIPLPSRFSNITLQNATILMPLPTRAPTSRILTETLMTQLFIGGQVQRNISSLTKVTSDYFYGDDLLQITIPSADTTVVTWAFSLDVETYSSYVDEQGLYTLTWPKQYPTVVQDGLKPELFIESDRQIFKDAVHEVMGHKLRLTAPYLVAKRLLQYCLKHSQVSGTATARGIGANGKTVDSIIGLNVQGATHMVEANGLGSGPDLVCLCVATLRAAGIPARPVIGLERGRGIKSRLNLVVWGEFYLNECGWIPFDPEIMRRAGVASHSIDSTWKGLGSIKELNTRIPLGYHFQPPGRATIPFLPCVWGWIPSPHRTLQMPALLNAKLYTAPQRGARP